MQQFLNYKSYNKPHLYYELALMAAGVAKDRINMKPPATVEAGGDPKQARRVDIKPGA